ncbi:hypothetical protein J6590_068090 [Homalodisca vitripennis]|nr:hypothetical protein J6590_068090 [Homalodisca vitripennis]
MFAPINIQTSYYTTSTSITELLAQPVGTSANFGRRHDLETMSTIKCSLYTIAASLTQQGLLGLPPEVKGEICATMYDQSLSNRNFMQRRRRQIRSPFTPTRGVQAYKTPVAYGSSSAVVQGRSQSTVTPDTVTRLDTRTL